MIELLLLPLGLYILIGPALGIWSLFRWRRARQLDEQRQRELEALGQRLHGLETELAARGRERPEAAPEAAAEAAAEPDIEEAAAAVPSEAPEEAALDWQAGAPEPGRDEDAEAETPPPVAPDLAELGRGLEERLTSRWLVWLGAVTISLSAAFLVKYSIEQGWLGPTVRVVLGFLLGAALVVAGEWLRRQPLQRAVAAIRPDYVPPALTAAGLFAAFASVYAAYELYALLAPVVAFVLLALVAAAAVALALLQGPFIALLGLLGGFLTPLLVSTETPSAWTLFPYLLALAAGALAVVRFMAWWWLGWAALAGAALWVVLWFMSAWAPGDGAAVGLYLLLLAALFLFLRVPADALDALVGWRRLLRPLDMARRVAWIAACTVALLTFMLARMDGYGAASLVTLALLVVLYLAVGRREAPFDALAVVVALLTVLAVAAWHLPHIITRREPFFSIEGRGYGHALGPIVPPELAPFLITTAIMAAVLGVGGFVALWGARRPLLWAGVSAATPVILLALAFWRIRGFEVDLGWAAAALVVAAIAVAAAARVERYRAREGLAAALGAYAAAAVAALSLAAAMALEEAWLTLALSLELPALAWIAGRLELRSLRRVALIVAAVVLVRLVLNYNLLDYALGTLPGLNWLLYGYGLPAAAFYFAARWFGGAARDPLVTVLEAGALAFAVLLVTLEIRDLVTGALDSPHYRLLEQSLQSIAWLALSYGLALRARRDARPVLAWGWRLLAGAAAVQVVVLQVLESNPLWSHEQVGQTLLFDLLLLAYAVPAGFAFLFVGVLRRAGHPRVAGAAGVLGLGLVFVYLSLEVRHAFHREALGIGPTSDAEWYAYSVAWLAYAGALLALGVWRAEARLRYASLAVVLVTVAKVFLSDMSALTGLYRVASFLGLGLSLVAIGYLYQRFVLPRPAPPPAVGGG